MKRITVVFPIFLTVGLCLISYLYFSKSSHITVEDKFGVFSLSCRGFEKASGKSVSGFGLCHCNNDISEMNVELNKDNISQFKSYLTENKYTILLQNFDEIEKSLNKRDYEEYQNHISKYNSNFLRLQQTDQQQINLYLKNLN